MNSLTTLESLKSLQADARETGFLFQRLDTAHSKEAQEELQKKIQQLQLKMQIRTQLLLINLNETLSSLYESLVPVEEESP